MATKTPWLRQPWLVGLVVALLVLVVSPGFDPFENTVWDLRMRTLTGPSPASKLIDVVLVDQASLDWIAENQGQSWPWPREYWAVLTDFFRRSETRATVFDIIFEQPSTLAGDDQVFAEALRAHGRVVLAEAGYTQGDRWTALPPTEPLASASAALGHVVAAPDTDGVIRRVLPALDLEDGTRLPGLAPAAWALGTGRTWSAPSGQPAVVRYRGPRETYRLIPAWQVFRSEVQLRSGEVPDLDPGAFRDHFVLIGYSAQGLADLRPSPLDNTLPGVLVHAAYLDNLLIGDTPRVLSPWSASALVLLWSLLAALATARVRRVAALVPVFFLTVGLPVAAGWIACLVGWWWPVVPAVAAALASGLSLVLLNYAAERRDRRFIQNAFGQYLSPQVIERLVRDPGQLKLGGETRTLSIFFSDVAGFTSISEGLGPEALTALLNDYLSEMTAIIYRHGGTVDKYEGDAIIAFWNAPLDVEDHALQAVRASLACQRRLDEIQPRLTQAAGRRVEARIGLNTGPVVVGNLGSAQRFNYTFLGDAGNLASRLEGINKVFGTRLLVSEFTQRACAGASDLIWRPIGRVRVVGKSQPVTVWQPREASAAAEVEALWTPFARGLESWYRGDFVEALAVFDALADRDPPSQRYAEQTRRLLAEAPVAWEGIWDVKEK